MRKRKNEFLYENIANDLRQAIDDGIYAVNDRMPSIRVLSAQYAVSVSTAIQAYQILEQEAYIESRPKSGIFVREQIIASRDIPQAITPEAMPTNVSVSQLAMSLVLESRAKNLAKLGAAVPGADILPLSTLSRHMSGVSRRMWKSPGIYADSLGYLDLRRQIAILMKEAGFRCHPNDIIVTNGALEALTLALRTVAKKGDTIAIESPTYFGVLQVIEKLGMKALEITTHSNSGIDPAALGAIITNTTVNACVLMPNISNPLGSIMPDENKASVVAMLNKANIPLIEDDVFGTLSYSQPRPKAAKAFDENNAVLYCSSFSKTLAPGYRIGWIVAGKHLEQVKYQKFLDNISTTIIPQITLAEFLARDAYKRCIKNTIRTYKQRMTQLRHWVHQYFPPNTRLTNPQGGMVLWIELPAEIDSLILYRLALEKNIAISPGILFSPRQEYSNYVRLSCGNLSGERALKAVKKVGALAHSLL